MDIKIKISVVRAIMKSTDESFSRFDNRYSDDSTLISLKIEDLKKKEIETFKSYLSKNQKDKENINALNNFKRFEQLVSNIDSVSIKDMRALETALKTKIGESPRKWVYRQNDDGTCVPYFVNKISYERTKSEDGSGSVYVDMRLSAINFTNTQSDWYSRRSSNKENESITFWSGAFKEEGKGTLLSEIVSKKNLVFETDKLFEDYEKSMREYNIVYKQMGKQFTGTNKGRTISDSWYSNRYVNLTTMGVPNKLVIDDWNEDKDERVIATNISSQFWGVTDESLSLPIIPLIRCFDLSENHSVIVHIENLEEYKYDKEVIHKLVIKPTHKDLLDILIRSSETVYEDIIKGKSGGIIVMCSGWAGVGKTLTAETYSEYMQKPLYKVQSSQLGIDVEQVEKNLKAALDNASRWKAIMLIDEADTYIHERGDDIQQNCIVGVFLRLLEYYKGVLFMTTNRATLIDDAILSRAMVHLKYDMPNKEDLKNIWQIQANQYGCKIDTKEIDKIIEKFPVMSGRDVKKTVQLCKRISEAKKKPITVDMVSDMSDFLSYTNKQELEPAK